MKKLFCYILILVFSVFLLSSCSNEQLKGWTDNDLYGTFETTHFITQELDLTEFDKKFVKILNAPIINISCGLETSSTIIHVYSCGDIIDKSYYDEEYGEIPNFYIPHLNAILYTDIPYYKQPYKIGDIISVEGFVIYRKIPKGKQYDGEYFMAYCFDISPAIIINEQTP